MIVDEQTARKFFTEAKGDIARAAYALATDDLVKHELPPPPRALDIRMAAEEIIQALALDIVSPMGRGILRPCPSDTRVF